MGRDSSSSRRTSAPKTPPRAGLTTVSPYRVATPPAAIPPAGSRILVFRVGLDHDDDGAWPDGGVHTLHRALK